MTKKIKILLVDDEDKIREELPSFLNSRGFIVETAANGEEAINKIMSSDFNILITDLIMPVMAGTALIKKVRSLKPNIGIIVITAFGDIESYIDLMDMGAFDYLNKPINLEDLYLTINNLVEELPQAKSKPH